LARATLLSVSANQLFKQSIVTLRPQSAFPPRRERLRSDERARLSLQHVEIVFQVENLLLALVAALVTRDAAACVPNFHGARIEPYLDRLAGFGRSRIEIGPHPHAAEPVHPRERDLGQLETVLSERQQMRPLFDHRRSHRLTVSGDLAPFIFA